MLKPPTAEGNFVLKLRKDIKEAVSAYGDDYHQAAAEAAEKLKDPSWH